MVSSSLYATKWDEEVLNGNVLMLMSASVGGTQPFAVLYKE